MFVGTVEHTDVGNYYRMADLFVSASDTETQGLTYVEAMAAGTKSVVFSTDYTENLFDDSEFGQTFTTRDEMLSETLAYLHEGPGKINPEKLAAKLVDVSADKFASRMVDNYTNIINNFDASKMKDEEVWHD